MLKNLKLFAICHPVSSDIKTIEDRLLYGDNGAALIFSSEEDAKKHLDHELCFGKLRFFERPGLVIEKIEIPQKTEKQECEYRLMVRPLDTAPSHAVEEEMKRIMDKHWTTLKFYFSANPDTLGAKVRAILWDFNITMKRVGEGRAPYRIQKRKPDTRNELAKLLGGNDVPEEWEDIPFLPALEYEHQPQHQSTRVVFEPKAF